jgi:hypothetical protein
MFVSRVCGRSISGDEVPWSNSPNLWRRLKMKGSGGYESEM